MMTNSSPSVNPFFDAAVFDLDGVVTKTALAHAASWKVMFDEYLRVREKRNSEPFQEFTHEKDYLPHVDGKPRYKGVSSFLESRNIHLPHGNPNDLPDQETICGLGNRKNVKFLEILQTRGVEVYETTVNVIRDLKSHGIRVGVASSSKNCQHVLQAAGLEDLFETRVDGVVSAELGLKGKPDPDIFVTAAQNLGSEPGRAIVVEAAVAGVQAGRKGRFALVIGLARENNQKELKENGADIVISDFAGVDYETIKAWFRDKPGD